jgi:hypothetical protein
MPAISSTCRHENTNLVLIFILVTPQKIDYLLLRANIANFYILDYFCEHLVNAKGYSNLTF